MFEYSNVLRRPKFRFDPADVRAVLNFVEHEAEYVTAPPTNREFADPDDTPFYEVAIGGGADYLVTGNSQHFPEESLICSPSQFLLMQSARE